MQDVRRSLRERLEHRLEDAHKSAGVCVTEDLAMLLLVPDHAAVHAAVTSEALKAFRRLYDERNKSVSERAWLVVLMHLLTQVSPCGNVRSLATRFKKALCETLLPQLVAGEARGEELLLCFALLKFASVESAELEQRAKAVPVETQLDGVDGYFLPALAKYGGFPVRSSSVFAEEFSRLAVRPVLFGRALASCLWGMVGTRNTPVFWEKTGWLASRPESWEKEPQLLMFAIHLQEMQSRRRLVQPSLKDVIVVDNNRTRLQCPLCGLDMLEASESGTCVLHGAVARFEAGAKEEVAPLVAAALAQLSWWSDTDKAQLLEVICGVVGMHELQVVTMTDLRMEKNANRVWFDTSSAETFRSWFRDKLDRSRQFPYYRFECAMEIRDIWRKHSEGRLIERALVAAKEAAAPVLAAQQALEDRIAGHAKGIEGLAKSLVSGAEDKRLRRAQALEEKEAALAEVRRELALLVANSPEVDALREAELRWNRFLHEESKLGAALNNLAWYNASVATIRTGSIGKEGLQFEHECLRIVEQYFNPTHDPEVRIFRSVKLPGVQFPEFASSEFDFWVAKGDEVLFIIEMKRSTGAVRGNLLKKLSAVQYLLSDAFNGTSYEGMRLSGKSFERFRGGAFFDNMYFFARQPVTVRDDEDVFALFMDNEDAFLTTLMEVTHLELDSPEFMAEARKRDR